MIDQPPVHPFTWTTEPWGPGLQSEAFARVARHLFTTRALALRGPGAQVGWEQAARAVGVRPERLVRLKQVHGVAAVVVRSGDALPVGADSDDGRPRADLVITDDPTIAVAVQVADCVPLLLADPTSGAVAAVHGGWRGTAAGIAGVAVSAMASEFGAKAADLLAVIGPSIGACCYQVGQDVLDAFRTAGYSAADLRSWFRRDEMSDAAGAAGRYRLDVPGATAAQLRAAGLDARNIAACDLCTGCHPALFPSYRRDGAGTGRIAAVVRSRRTA